MVSYAAVLGHGVPKSYGYGSEMEGIMIWPEENTWH